MSPFPKLPHGRACKSVRRRGPWPYTPYCAQYCTANPYIHSSIDKQSLILRLQGKLSWKDDAHIRTVGTAGLNPIPIPVTLNLHTIGHPWLPNSAMHTYASASTAIEPSSALASAASVWSTAPPDAKIPNMSCQPSMYPASQ